MSITLPIIKTRIPIQIALLVSGFAVLVTMSLTSLWLAHESDRASQKVAHTLEVNATIVTYQGALRRAESGERGFLITGESAYLNDYTIGQRRLAELQVELERQIADNPQQLAKLRDVLPLVQQKMEKLATTIALKQQGRNDEVVAITKSGAGLELMNRILAQIVAMINDERSLLQARQDYADRTNLLLFVVNFAGGLTITVLALASISVIRRNTHQLAQAHAELAQANEVLEERVAERTTDLREANDEIQRFAFIVSHDLRSPLVNIMGFTSELEALQNEIFSDAEISPEQRAAQRKEVTEALDFIKTSIGKMDRLIKAILNLSRAGRREFNPQPVSLDNLFKSLVGDVTHRLQEIGGQIDLGAIPQITSDRLALEQIFSNLIDNAIKYRRDDRPVQISIDSEERGNFAVIRVADNGRGIEKRDYERIFELFRRAGPQDRPGEGIGLAHVRALVRRLGGSIRVDSIVGQGTTFTVILPKRWIPAA